MKKLHCLVINLLLYSSFCQAQGNLQKGFVVSTTNDTIFGELEIRSDTKNYESCRFTKGDSVIEFNSSQINGFGYVKGKCFTSGIVEGNFAENLVDGHLKLYKYKTLYYLKKGTDKPVKLGTSTVIKTMDEENFFIPDNKWRGMLAYAIYDCIPNGTNMVENMNLNDESLSKVVILYNKRKNGTYLEFKDDKPWSKIEYGVTAGMEKSILHKSDENNRYSYLKNEYVTTNPSIGIFMGFSSPRLSERLSFQPELYLTKVSYDGLIHNTQFSESIYETHINWTSLSLPISARYTYPLGHYSAYIQGGLLIDYLFKPVTRYVRTRINGGVSTTDPEVRAFFCEEYSWGLGGGIGLQRSFKQFQAGIAFRYNRMSNVARLKALDMNAERFSLSLQILTKGK